MTGKEKPFVWPADGLPCRVSPPPLVDRGLSPVEKAWRLGLERMYNRRRQGRELEQRDETDEEYLRRRGRV